MFLKPLEKRKKKKSPKTAVVEVQPDSHKVEEKPITPKEEVEVQVTPMIGAFDGVCTSAVFVFLHLKKNQIVEQSMELMYKPKYDEYLCLISQFVNN